MNNKPKVVSLFSGCGGFDLGFKDNGFELVYACDNEPAAVRCYTDNIDDRAYVRDVTSKLFHQEIAEIGKCDVVIGGFPCQGFSKAGPKNEADPRNQLYLEMKHAVEVLQPQVFVAENVDGMSQNFGGAFIDKISTDFGALGYHVQHRILQAADYGVPQYRRRIFFVGVRNDARSEFTWPVVTHASKARNGEFIINREAPLFEQPVLQAAQVVPAKTIADAIADITSLDAPVTDHKVVNKWPETYPHIFAAIKEGQKLCNVRHASSSVYTWQIPAAFGEVTERERTILDTIGRNRRHKKYGSIPNGNPLSIDVIESLSSLTSINGEIESLLQKKYLQDKAGKYDLQGAMFCSGLFKRPLWDEPSPTVLTVFDNPRYFLHPSENRPLTVRECARLQGFPDSFRFCKDEPTSKELKEAYRLIGNAVPPPLARAIAKSVQNLITDSNNVHSDYLETANAHVAA